MTKGGIIWLQIEFPVINHVLSSIPANRNRVQPSARVKNQLDRPPNKLELKAWPENQSQQ